MSRYRGRPKVVLEAVCHRHPDQILIRPEMDIPTRSFTRHSRALPGLDEALLAEGQRRLEVASCPRCKVRPQWSRQKVQDLLARLPEGVWRVTDIEMNTLIQHPQRAAEYLRIRGTTLGRTKPGFGA